jgi:hypothetical protein
MTIYWVHLRGLGERKQYGDELKGTSAKSNPVTVRQRRPFKRTSGVESLQLATNSSCKETWQSNNRESRPTRRNNRPGCVSAFDFAALEAKPTC